MLSIKQAEEGLAPCGGPTDAALGHLLTFIPSAEDCVTVLPGLRAGRGGEGQEVE